jgi:flavin reductase (DIM6/NTAB) family NADH-FMN oxidoreductase RutF
MQFDIDGMAPIDRYELLLGTIVPRPIALITSLGPNGAVNAAPYSLFNVMGHDPAADAPVCRCKRLRKSF